MARMPRLVVPNYPHHVTQRGNRKMRTFFCEADYLAYLDLVAETRRKCSVEIWAYCLMPNHVHYVIVPDEPDGISRFMQHSHRRYARRINKREDWRGHLWQERYFSVPMDERHLYAAVRYIELNPVEAGLCKSALDWRWSSARAHVTGEEDALVNVQPMLERVPNWVEYLASPHDSDAVTNLQNNAMCGRPLGDDRFVEQLEQITGRSLKRKKPGPKPRRSS